MIDTEILFNLIDGRLLIVVLIMYVLYMFVLDNEKLTNDKFRINSIILILSSIITMTYSYTIFVGTMALSKILMQGFLQGILIFGIVAFSGDKIKELFKR